MFPIVGVFAAAGKLKLHLACWMLLTYTSSVLLQSSGVGVRGASLSLRDDDRPTLWERGRITEYNSRFLVWGSLIRSLWNWKVYHFLFVWSHKTALSNCDCQLTYNKSKIVSISVSYKVTRVLITRKHENTEQYFTENSTYSKMRQNRTEQDRTGEDKVGSYEKIQIYETFTSLKT